MMKRKLTAIFAVLIGMSMLAGCAAEATAAAAPAATEATTAAATAAPTEAATPAPTEAETETETEAPAAAGGAIAGLTREDGSGTRSAFTELIGIENTAISLEFEIQSSTDAIVTGVAGNPAAISYISLGSLNDTVKAVTVGGVEATVDTVKSGEYAIQRPFNIATKGTPDASSQDFINFILSAEGQAIANDEGYVAVVDGAAPFAGANPTGKIMVGGSSSVSPLMGVLAEAYNVLNPGLEIEIQTTDSGGGMTDTIGGVLQIGMASRALKEEELAELTPIVIAQDGIAVIVNNENPVADLSVETISGIFTGAITDWSEVA
jgi:phosphate transport system substrate-binding protein